MGTMQFGWTADEHESFAVLDAFVAAGGNFIDTADIYSRWVPGNHGGDAERIIGRWLAARGNRESRHRHKGARPHVARPRRRRPRPQAHPRVLGQRQPRTPADRTHRPLPVPLVRREHAIEETLDAFAELIAEGKSAPSASPTTRQPCSRRPRAAGADGRPLETLQPHYSLVHRAEFEAELQQLCLEHNLAVIPYSPLASGFLTGKYMQGGEASQSTRTNAVKQYFTDDGLVPRSMPSARSPRAHHDTCGGRARVAARLSRPSPRPSSARTPRPNSPTSSPRCNLHSRTLEIEQLNAASQPFLANGDSHPGR